MAESKPAFDKLDQLTQTVEDLKRQVAAIGRSKTLKAEVVEDLLEGNGSLAKVFLVVGSAMTQGEISNAFEKRWGHTISKGGLSGKLTVLGEMDLVRPAEVKANKHLLYSVTEYGRGLALQRALEPKLRSK